MCIALGGVGCSPSDRQITSETIDTPAALTKMEAFEGWRSGRWQGVNIYQRRPGPGDSQEANSHPTLPLYSPDDFESLAEAGANLVVLSHPGVFTESPPYKLDQALADNLDRLVDMADKAGLATVVAMRTGPGRNEATFFDDPAQAGLSEADAPSGSWADDDVRDGWVKMWSFLAERYRNHQAVVGYDLLVEPHELDSQKPEPALDWVELQQRLTAAIRSVDSQTPILVEAEEWGSPRRLGELPTPTSSRVVFVIHNYEPFAYAVEAELGTVGHEAGDAFVTALSSAVDVAQDAGVPLAVLEFGVAKDSVDNIDYLRRAAEAIEEEGLASAVWMWDPATDPNWRSDDLGMRSTANDGDQRLEVLQRLWMNTASRLDDN